ncbi:sodium:solute symporter family protein [Trichlorobacter ammonificans]|uniref:Cation acetate symporter n=1 Tax=Trichlorobacter ammonificans TaxID=2916410 RepID=A0ABN8HHC0_9BACT|nr:sodium:solute symporter family protein [Trichlorobacter ammonificans]CAH2030884.1 putative cation acetate symporter [Trichlorobacter ammonificans]
MSILTWTYIIVGLSFSLYIGIAFYTKAKSTGDFYAAEQSVHPVLNGMATGADWMSAASFISMAGLISFMGRDGSMYLMGWTGGYVLLAMLLAPYLRKYGKFTVPQFIGDRYYSNSARVIALVCAIFISFTYVAGQMRGVGVVFSRFLEVDINTGVIIGMALVFLYATMGGMKGITYTQVAQYVVLIIAYMIPAIFVSLMLTGNPIPQLGFGGTISAGGAQILGDASAQGKHMLDVLNGLHKDLGFAAYTTGLRPKIDVFFITIALMVGTAGLPHVIIRFFTVPKIRDARSSAGWALLFIAILYTTAPAVAAFARTNFIKTLHNVKYEDAPTWFKNWEKTKLVAWKDKNGDGIMQYAKGNQADPKSANELKIDNDIIVLASPEIAKLPNWVVALVAAGGLAAALSTAAGLLLVISAAISHDLLKSILMPDMSEKTELLAARIAAGVAVCIAGLFGIYPPGFVAQVVAFAFGLAAASFFPAIIMGVFNKKITKEGALSGMIVGIVFTAAYIIYFKFMMPASYNVAANWWFGISPEGIGTLGMILNFVVAWVVSKFTPEPPQEVQDLVASLRYPGKEVPPPAASH